MSRVKQLTKKQSRRREELVDKLETRKAQVQTAIEEFQEKMQTLWNETVVLSVETYNEAVREADELRVEITDAQQEYYGNRSEKWQNSDAGSTYEEWQSSWENAEFSDANLSMPEIEIDLDVEFTHEETMRELPEEVGA
jgi:hypothetical protein